ncbi:MAG: Negative regulator of genetic competence ClpC/MecB [bacterium ADurb.Bin212]|nr:MAG: Negative regulator of genetic competence ClpC/MecB [bacterium ADurb.Bin212]
MDNIFSKFTPNLKQALMMSEKISKEQNSLTDTEHQLLALILQKGTLANDILSMFDISVDRAQLVSALVSKKKQLNGVQENAKEAIKLAVQFAMKYRHQNVDCEHLLLALISNKNFNSFSIIERMGVNPKDIKKQLDSIFLEAGKSIDAEQTSNEENFSEEMPEDITGMPPFPGPIGVKRKQEKSAIKEFTINVSEQAAKGKIDPVIGRNNEIERIVQILIRRKKNNPVLIGEPGVGKTAIIEGLALKIKHGDVPSAIADKEIYTLDLSALLAGTMYRGQFEARIKKLLEEIEKNKNAILFIDELHTVIGAGSAEGSLDAANILKPKLARGEIRIIGATTLEEYKKHIEKDTAFERRFQVVQVPEPSVEDTIKILQGVAREYEKHHNVAYQNDALEAAAKLSSRYIQDRFLPDKAIDLIDEAAAFKNITNKKSIKLSELEKKLKNASRKKDESVANEDYEKATYFKQKELSLLKEIDKINQQKSGSVISVITPEDISRIVSRWTGIPVSNMDIKEKNKYISLEKSLKKKIVGQDEAVSKISQALRRSRVGISNPNRPVGSFIFLGPTGVGKTELVKVLSQEIFGSARSLIKIDMSEFMEKHNVSRLVGAPAGYVGYDEGGQLTERVRRQPYSLVLFDEIEKAHPEVFNIMLQIMEDGELTDAKGRVVNFRNTLIVMTSNLGTDLLNKQATIGFSGDGSYKTGEIDYQKMSERVEDMVSKHFKPEFLNRVDEIVIFKPLSRDSILKIAKLEIDKLKNRLATEGVRIDFSVGLINWVANKGYKPEFGARPMRRVISEHLENKISTSILNGEISPGAKLIADIVGEDVVFLKSHKN